MEPAGMSGRRGSEKSPSSVPFTAVGRWANGPATLGLSFLSYKMGIIVIVIMFCED